MTVTISVKKPKFWKYLEPIILGLVIAGCEITLIAVMFIVNFYFGVVGIVFLGLVDFGVANLVFDLVDFQWKKSE